MEIEIGDFKITGRSGDYVVEQYVMKEEYVDKKKTGKMYRGLRETKHFFGRFSQCLVFIMNTHLSDADVKSIREVLASIKSFRDLVEQYDDDPEKSLKTKPVEESTLF